MARTITKPQVYYEFGPFTPGWNERKKHRLVNALEQLIAVGFEDEFGRPPFVNVDHSGVRILRLTHLDSEQAEELRMKADRTYSQIMTEA